MFFGTTRIALHQGFFSFSGCCADFSPLQFRVDTNLMTPRVKGWSQGCPRLPGTALRTVRAAYPRLFGSTVAKKDDLVNPIRTHSFEELGKIRIIETPSVVNGRMGGQCQEGGGVNLQLFWKLQAYYTKYNSLN